MTKTVKTDKLTDSLMLGSEGGKNEEVDMRRRMRRRRRRRRRKRKRRKRRNKMNAIK